MNHLHIESKIGRVGRSILHDTIAAADPTYSSSRLAASALLMAVPELRALPAPIRAAAVAAASDLLGKLYAYYGMIEKRMFHDANIFAYDHDLSRDVIDHFKGQKVVLHDAGSSIGGIMSGAAPLVSMAGPYGAAAGMGMSLLGGLLGGGKSKGAGGAGGMLSGITGILSGGGMSAAQYEASKSAHLTSTGFTPHKDKEGQSFFVVRMPDGGLANVVVDVGVTSPPSMNRDMTPGSAEYSQWFSAFDSYAASNGFKPGINSYKNGEKHASSLGSLPTLKAQRASTTKERWSGISQNNIGFGLTSNLLFPSDPNAVQLQTYGAIPTYAPSLSLANAGYTPSTIVASSSSTYTPANSMVEYYNQFATQNNWPSAPMVLAAIMEHVQPKLGYSALQQSGISFDEERKVSPHYCRTKLFDTQGTLPSGEFFRSNLVVGTLQPMSINDFGAIDVSRLPYRVFINTNKVAAPRALLAGSHEIVHLLDNQLKLNIPHELIPAVANELLTVYLPFMNQLSAKLQLT